MEGEQERERAEGEQERERAAGKSSRNAQRVTAAVGYANGKVAICSRWLLYTGPRCGYHFTVPLFSSILSLSLTRAQLLVFSLSLARSLPIARPTHPLPRRPISIRTTSSVHLSTEALTEFNVWFRLPLLLLLLPFSSRQSAGNYIGSREPFSR